MVKMFEKCYIAINKLFTRVLSKTANMLKKLGHCWF